MSIKNKVFAVSMAAAISVTSFMSAKADKCEDPCIECGEYSTIAIVVETKREYTGATRLCEHGYEYEADLEIALWEKYRYYCGDCDISWERWQFDCTYWRCTHNN